jgi:group I intron endonuclease
MIIYKTTNLINGKFYVGKDERNKPDYLGSGINLNRAIKKYGRENFIKETIEVCSTREELIEREKYWIKETKAQELGYNIADGGLGGNTISEENKDRILNGFKGGRHTPETIEKIKRTREERKKQNPDAYKMSQENRELMSKVHKGKVHPKEWKRNHSEKMKELYHSGDTSQFQKFIENQKGENKRAENNPMWGRKASEETKRKQSEYHKNNPVRYWSGKKQSPESNEKRRQSLINKTPEQMLETYIKSHISKMGYEPSEEKKQIKLQEYIKKKEE